MNLKFYWRLMIFALALAFLGLASAQTITLRWWDYMAAGAGYVANNNAIARFMAAHPHIRIERTAYTFGDLKAAIVRAAATRTMPDIVIIDNPDHQAMAAQGALTDITDLIQQWPDRELYFAGPWASTVFEGRNYGIPWRSNATALYYNETLLAEAGLAPPTTWEELRSAAKALTAPGRHGLCFSAVPTEEGTFTFLPFLWQAGGDIPTLGDEASIETLAFWNTLVNEDQTVSPAITTWSQGDVLLHFMAGRCAMMINGPWQLPVIRAETLDFSWNVAPWPCHRECASALGGENFAIGLGANVEAAWEVIRWLTQPEQLEVYLQEAGMLPNRADMAGDPVWHEDPILGQFVDMVAIARARAYGPNYPQISEQIMTMVHSVIAGGQAPEVAAAEAARIIKPLLP
ncbi:MAG: sugar ABC transporter substrate-binding protein [Truepera sp.]|nr:sugar ABC transporter substrate-binding protein [Truepera sp.]